MKLKFSYKDFLLIVGILVAVVITLTTLVRNERQREETKTITPAKKSSLNASPSVVIPWLLREVDLKNLLTR
jgi:hypothetical protein